jgi:predicted phosphodiesterase
MRRTQIRYLIAAACLALVLHAAHDVRAAGSDADGDILFTFVTANDGHWRPPEIAPIFTTLHTALIDDINARGDVDFVIFNGDQVDRYAYIEWWNEHNPDDTLSDTESRFNIPWLHDVRDVYDSLDMPFYAVQGNHDRATWEYWESVWGYPAYHHFAYEDYAFILMTRHDDRLVYLPVDYAWLGETLESYRHKAGVFIFIHAGDAGVNNAEFREFIAAYPNVLGMFFGHFHTDAVEQIEGLYYLWNGNFMNPIIHFGYRVVQVYEDGRVESYFNNIGNAMQTNHVVLQTGTTVPNGSIPETYRLYQNYPNPFNPSTNIRYDLPRESDVELAIYNTLGQRVDMLVRSVQPPGSHTVRWEPRPSLGSGVYLYRLAATGSAGAGEPVLRMRRMILLR